VSDDPERTLAELRARLAAEGLPKLSVQALRAAKVGQMGRPATRPEANAPPKLSDEARRLYQKKSDPHWLWRK
jgi:hypothetical protein